MCQQATAADSRQPEIQLIGFPRINSTLLAGSPFVGKLEVILRLAGLPYAGFTGSPADKKVAPRGKLPSMKYGKDFVTDSSAIVRHLQARCPQLAPLTPTDPKMQVLACALQRMLEEHTYFVVMYWLWVDAEVSGVFVPRMISTFGLPWPLRPIVQRSVKKDMCKNLHGQGIERMTAEEVGERAAQDFGVCAELLAHSPFLTGSSPTAADCFLFALLDLVDGSLQGTPQHGRVWAHVARWPSLVAFYDRMKEQLFPSGPDMNHWQAPFQS